MSIDYLRNVSLIDCFRIFFLHTLQRRKKPASTATQPRGSHQSSADPEADYEWDIPEVTKQFRLDEKDADGKPAKGPALVVLQPRRFAARHASGDGPEAMLGPGEAAAARAAAPDAATVTLPQPAAVPLTAMESLPLPAALAGAASVPSQGAAGILHAPGAPAADAAQRATRSAHAPSVTSGRPRASTSTVPFAMAPLMFNCEAAVASNARQLGSVSRIPNLSPEDAGKLEAFLRRKRKEATAAEQYTFCACGDDGREATMMQPARNPLMSRRASDWAPSDAVVGSGMPLYVTVVIKRNNGKKHHSHRLFFEMVCPIYKHVLGCHNLSWYFATDAGTLYEPFMVPHLIKYLREHDRCAACCAHQRIMAWADQAAPNESTAEAPWAAFLRAVQACDFEGGLATFNGASCHMSRVANGSCRCWCLRTGCVVSDEAVFGRGR